jgi:hypothetical protein
MPLIGHIIACKSPQTLIYRKPTGPHGRYGRVQRTENLLLPQVTEPPTAQPVATTPFRLPISSFVASINMTEMGKLSLYINRPQDECCVNHGFIVCRARFDSCAVFSLVHGHLSLHIQWILVDVFLREESGRWTVHPTSCLA